MLASSYNYKGACHFRYVDDAGDLDAPAGMSYADWEAQRAEVQIPKWMESILRIPGGAFCLLLILLPFTLVRLLSLCLTYSPCPKLMTFFTAAGC
jgi:hypothetical protein